MTTEAGSVEPRRIEPDTKDWTWVLFRACSECGFDARELTTDGLSAVVRHNASVWTAVLITPDVTLRPDPGTWSVLEYACHVRDVHRIFDERLRLMLDRDDPEFANWDQDEAAQEGRYAEQDPATVSAELLAAARAVADRYDAVPDDAWGRRGLRSNGSEFTIASLGRYHLHDVVHHLHDVRVAGKRATVAAYDTFAGAFRDGAKGVGPLPLVRRFADALPSGARVLEIGSGPGRDARALESAGLDVRRTDVSPGFVDLLRAEGHAADVVDPLTDDLADPARPSTAYDGVWAAACLLHVDRPDLPLVLARLAGATRSGGVLHVSMKEGDGEGWSTHGNVLAPRHFVYWREDALREALVGAGWEVVVVTRGDGVRGDRWLEVLARRSDG